MKFATSLAVGLSLLTGASMVKSYELGVGLERGLREAASDVNDAQTIQRLLLHRVRALRPAPYVLRGLESPSRRPFAIEPVDTLVLYVFGARCPFSLKSIPFLNELHAAGVSVVGVGLDNEPRLSESFARAAEVEFPILASPSGSAIEVVPREAAPLTAVFLGGELRTLLLGPLEEEQRESLVRMIGVSLPGYR